MAPSVLAHRVIESGSGFIGVVLLVVAAVVVVVSDVIIISYNNNYGALSSSRTG